MRWVPPGPFAMGSEEFYPEEGPVHRVELDGFRIDEHPVTVAEFRRVGGSCAARMRFMIMSLVNPHASRSRTPRRTPAKALAQSVVRSDLARGARFGEGRDGRV
jgi:formylglycine-generating enzyme required for sulfatase activity